MQQKHKILVESMPRLGFGETVNRELPHVLLIPNCTRQVSWAFNGCFARFSAFYSFYLFRNSASVFYSNPVGKICPYTDNAWRSRFFRITLDMYVPCRMTHTNMNHLKIFCCFVSLINIQCQKIFKMNVFRDLNFAL